MLRDSTSSRGDFVLSVAEGVRVSHYIVQLSETGSYFIGDQEFADLVQVLEFYKMHILDTTTLSVPLVRRVATLPGSVFMRRDARLIYYVFILLVRARLAF